mmetsp:Transcript_38764/g.110582  ORF Transcript_38764/g.110582 Transcript_38764/m.110582 type:complete len:223 (+) Transcript_38764:407-1075(+)
MSSGIMCGTRSASLYTGRCVALLNFLPTSSASSRRISSSPSLDAYLPNRVARGLVTSGPIGDCEPSSRDLSAASSRSRVVKPTQTRFSLTTGKSWTSSVPFFAFRALFTRSNVALGGRMASSGTMSISSRATVVSRASGSSGVRKGIFFRAICSSSKPRSLMSLLRKSETATAIISGGTRLRSFAQPVMKITTATDICLKPQSMAALPIMAYTPDSVVIPKW